MKAGSCIDVNHWSVWFPVPKSTDEVLPKLKREGKTHNEKKVCGIAGTLPGFVRCLLEAEFN